MNNMFTTTEAISKLSLAEKVGQFFMPAAFINDTETEAKLDLIANMIIL